MHDKTSSIATQGLVDQFGNGPSSYRESVPHLYLDKVRSYLRLCSPCLILTFAVFDQLKLSNKVKCKNIIKKMEIKFG